MIYEEALNSYLTEFLENILNTDYKYGITYKIDKEKYNDIYSKQQNHKSSILEGDVVSFAMTSFLGEDNKIHGYTFIVWPENSDSNNPDIFRFFDDDYNNDIDACKSYFEEFVRDILGTIICIDKDCLKKLIDDRYKEHERIKKEIDKLQYILTIISRYKTMRKDEIKPGVKVWYHPVIGDPFRKEAEITSEAFEMCGTDCCMIDICSGCVDIEALEKR